MATQVPNIFVEQYDQGQKKIRADLMDENFAYVCTQIDATADAGSAAAAAAQSAADVAQTTADGKANADLDDVTADGKAVMAHAAMPSGQYENISYSGGGAYEYTAPADGYVGITGQVSQPDFYRGVMLSYRPSISSSDYVGIYSTGAYPTCFLPVARGRSVVIAVNTGVTVSYCRFYYANGSVTA